MTEEQEREAFEAWADDQGFALMRVVRGDDYQDLRTQGPWEAWQARASLAKPQPVGGALTAAPSQDKAAGVRAFLESTLRTNSRDLDDWRQDVEDAIRTLATLSAPVAQPGEAVSETINTIIRDVAELEGSDSGPDYMVVTADELRVILERNLATPIAAQPAAAEPMEVTEEMVTAYLTANDAYWKRTDELPARNPAKWRQGTPSEATRVSLRAALDAMRAVVHDKRCPAALNFSDPCNCGAAS